MFKAVSRNLDHSITTVLVAKLAKLDVISTRTTISYVSIVGRRYDPRHGPSIYKNKYEDNTQLEGSEFDKHYRTKDDVEVKFTDRRIDRLKNPTSADVYHYKYYQSRRFARDVYARHGMASGVDPSICFPDKRELKKMQKLLQQERPISEMLAEIKAERAKFAKQKSERDQKLKSTLDKMPEMIRDWMETERNERERAELLSRKRNEYSERIRQHYGATVAPHSSEHNRILEILLEEDLNRQKGFDPDEKKKRKLAKKKAKQMEAEEKLNLSKHSGNRSENEGLNSGEVRPVLSDSVVNDELVMEESKA